MARLPDYEAPSRELQPSDKGAAGFEQAGRRIAPAYNEAGTLTRQAGEAQADVIRSRKWPFDMLELTRSLDVWHQAEAKVASESANKGVAFKVEGGGSSGKGGGILDDPTDASGGKGHKSKRGSDVGGMSVAAAGMAKIAGQLAKGNGYRNSEIVNGIDILDPKVQAEMARARPIDTVLKDGQLLHIDRKTGQVLDEKGKFDKEGRPIGPNSDAANAADKYAGDMANGLGKDPEYVKKFGDKFGYDPNTGAMRNRSDANGGLHGGGIETGGTGPDYSSNGYDRYGNPNYPPMPGAYTPTPPGGNSTSSFWDRADVANREAGDAIRDTISWADRQFGSGQGYNPPSNGAPAEGSDPMTGADEGGENYGGGSDNGTMPSFGDATRAESF